LCHQSNETFFIERNGGCGGRSNKKRKPVGALKEKGQYVTNAFTITWDYLVFVIKFLPFTISGASC
jgi:hypothetical protein